MPNDPISFETLPEEILVYIFQYVLAGEKPQQVLSVNKHWYRISQDENLWKSLYIHFIGDPARVSEVTSEKVSFWKMAYNYLIVGHSRISEVSSKGIYRELCLTILDQFSKLPDNHKMGYCVYHGYDRLLSNFLEKNPNADFHFKNENKKKNLIHAIHLAANRDHLNLFDILLARDPRVLNLRDIIGWMPLHYACNGGYTEMVAALLSKHVPIDLSDNDEVLGTKVLVFGSTRIVVATEGKQKLPLHIAAEKGYSEIVKLFLKYIKENKDKVGYVLNIPDNRGWTVLHYMCANKQEHFEIVKQLIEMGASPDLTTEEGETALHLACEKNHGNIAKHLSTVAPTLVNKRNKAGWSVMHKVCKAGNFDLVKFFKEQYNVSVLQLTNAGDAPAELIPSNCQDREEIIGFLKAQNRTGHEKLKKIKTTQPISLATGVVCFVLAIATVLVVTLTPLATSMPNLLWFLLPFTIFSISVGIGGTAWYFRSLNNFRNEIENANQNGEGLANDLENEKKPLLENQESNIPNSYATFPKEFSQANDCGVKILDLEDNSSLTDQRKIKKQPVETAGQEIENHDIETGNQERVISLSQTP